MDDHPVSDLPTPNPEYGPEEIITLQLDALTDNDTPHENAGIQTAYNFASPANRRRTGPLPRFTRMVQNRRYSPMIDHMNTDRGELRRDDGPASQLVTLTGPDGRTVTYEFIVSRQDSGKWDACWMTDSVRVVR